MIASQFDARASGVYGFNPAHATLPAVLEDSIDGVVSERKASVGDTASVGKELVKVIDPRSMRLEGLVSADRLNELKLG